MSTNNKIKINFHQKKQLRLKVLLLFMVKLHDALKSCQWISLDMQKIKLLMFRDKHFATTKTSMPSHVTLLYKSINQCIYCPMNDNKCIYLWCMFRATTKVKFLLLLEWAMNLTFDNVLQMKLKLVGNAVSNVFYEILQWAHAYLFLKRKDFLLTKNMVL